MTPGDQNVVETIRDWLRPYQLDLLTDSSRYRVVLKARQIGVSEELALECVLVASGLVELLPEDLRAMLDVRPDNCVVVSRRDSEAKDLIEKCKEWVRRLRLVDAFQPYLETEKWSASQVEFSESRFKIVAETQNPDAARGKTGHIYLDEYAFYAYQREIFRSAAAATESKPHLRITIVSTPNGMGDHFHEVWTDRQFYGDWSRHKVDVYDAVEQGMPVDIDKIRTKYTADQFAQEFECDFLGGELRYFPLALYEESKAPPMREGAHLVFGVDAASTVDFTAVQAWRVNGTQSQMWHTFTLPHLPYRGDPVGGRLGQIDIIAALVAFYGPAKVCVDRTGDASNAWVQGAGLFKLLAQRLSGQVPVQGVTISKSWKDTWVQKMKVGLQTHQVTVASDRRDKVFSKRAVQMDPKEFERIVSEGFENSPYPVLRSDFLKVRRKWTKNNSTTFDTERTDTGHGDSFWAAVIGYSGHAVETPSDDLTRKLMDVAERGASSVDTDYQEYL